MSRILTTAPLLGLTCLVLLGGEAVAQPRQPYTRPVAPSRDLLDRFHLQAQWEVYVPVGGLDDGIGLVQWLDGDVFVQTRRSRLVVIDGQTGEIKWDYVPERPSTNLFPVGVNERSVFLLNGAKLYSLIRATGVRVWDYNLTNAPSSGPLVQGDRILVTVQGTKILNIALPDPVKILRDGNPDETRARQRDNPTTPEGYLYRDTVTDPAIDRGVIPPVQLGAQRVEGFLGTNRTPSISVLPSLRPPYRVDIGGRSPSISVLQTLRTPYRLPDGNKTPSVVALPPSVARAMELNSYAPKLIEPKLNWVYASPAAVGYPLQEMRGRILASTLNSLAYTLESKKGRVTEQVLVQGEITSSPAVAGDIGYLPDSASYLHAHNFRLDREEWRYIGPGPLDVAPLVTTDRVFVGSRRYGIASVHRELGFGLWTNPNAVRLLATNPKYVYAADEMGRMLVIDRARGLTLARWDGAAQFNIPITNEQTDRVLIGANNGLLVCLRDRDYKDPVPVYIPPPPGEGEEGEDMMPDPAMP